MTMPMAAAAVKDFPDVSPAKMTDGQIELALDALRADLPGNPLGFIAEVAPESDICECGAVHLAVDDPRLDEATRSSLLRLLATPFGDIVREHYRRVEGYKTIRFGWSGIAERAPHFVACVDQLGVRNTHPADIDHGDLRVVIDAISADMLGIMPVISQAASTGESIAVPPEPGESGRAAWQALIGELMFVFATPLRKYVEEWCWREFGMRVAAINCCMVPVGDRGDSSASWGRKLMATQIDQQITPDC